MNSMIWTQYWQENHINSLGDFQKNYSGSLRKCWFDFFSNIMSSSYVLDLCCGNGSLTNLFKEYDLNKYNQSSVIGVDYASLSISDDLTKDSNVSFEMNVNIENLPYESEKFDFIMSNFGLEYSNIDVSIPEMLRVLKPDGLIQLVSHIENSELILSSIKIKEMLDDFFLEGNVFDTFQSLIKLLVIDKFRAAEELRILLNKQLNRFINEYDDVFIEFDFIGFLKYVLSSINKDTHKVVFQYKNEIHFYHKRLISMIDSSIAQETFCEKLLEKNAKLLQSELIFDEKNNLLAFKVILTK